MIFWFWFFCLVLISHFPFLFLLSDDNIGEISLIIENIMIFSASRNIAEKISWYFRDITNISAKYRETIENIARHVMLRLEKGKIVFFFISVFKCWRRKRKSFVVVVKEGLSIKQRLSPPTKIFLWIRDWRIVRQT